MKCNFKFGNWSYVTTFGTCLALFVVAPLLIQLIGKLFLGGNKAAAAYTDTYIRNSVKIIIEIPPKHSDIDNRYEVFTSRAWFSGMAHTETSVYNQYVFYSSKYKKYVAVISFEGGYNTIKRGTNDNPVHLDIEQLRGKFLFNVDSISAYVNRVQWQDPTYGSEENPVPVFFNRVIPEDAGSTLSELNYLTAPVYRKFVELYLCHGLSEKEFNRLYGEDMKKIEEKQGKD